MQEICVIDPQIKTESLIPLQTVILGGPNQSINANGSQPPSTPQNGHPQQQPPPPPKLGNNNCDKTNRAADNSYWMPTETGFINSQPSMAEFLTHLGPDSSPKMDQTPYGNPESDPSVPEYPWMKEKKTARKNNSQSEF
jgi:hypothetical protein